MPRRRAHVLLPLEEAILELGVQRLRDGAPEFFGFSIARDLERAGFERLTGHGTLYKVLERLERGGLLVSRWESVEEMQESRPRRRMYQVTDGALGAISRSREIQGAARAGFAS